MWVSLAGPMSNFVLAILAAIPFRLGMLSIENAFTASMGSANRLLPTLPQLFLEFILLNLVLMLFNLIPIAPLDGDKIADYFFPPAWSETLASLRPYGPMILMLLFVAGPVLGIDVLGWVLRPTIQFLFNVLVG